MSVMKEKQHRIPPHQQARARELRRKSTFPERLLWSHLRNGKLLNLKFRRQHPVGPFIVDFYCSALQLVIEVDGMSHSGQGKKDDMRTIKLCEEFGVTRVIRITNDDIIQNLEGVILHLRKELAKPSDTSQDEIHKKPR